VPDDDVTISDQVTRLYELIAGFHTTHLLEVGRQLGVWTHLTAHPESTSGDLAASLDLNPFYTEVLCKTAFSAGILERGDRGWVMGAHMGTLLGSPGTTFDLSRIARTHIMLAEDYVEYAEAFRHGSDLTYQNHDPGFMSEVASGLRSLPSMFLQSVLPELPAAEVALNGASQLLDIGCGGGWAIATFAEAYPTLHVTGVEIEPASVALAEELITSRGLTDRCHVIHGDASVLDAEAGFDVATMFLVYHEISPERKAGVLGAAFNALRPGGLLVIFDEVYPETDTALRAMPSRYTALAQWYELIWGNVIDTRQTVVDAGREARFHLVEELSYSRFHIFVLAKPV